MLLDYEWCSRIGLPWSSDYPKEFIPMIKLLTIWRFLDGRTRGPWWNTVEHNEKSYDGRGRLTFNQPWHQLRQKKQGIFGYGYSSTLSPIQGYRHPWVMNKIEFIEVYNRVMNDKVPTDTIPDDRFRIPNIISTIDSYVGGLGKTMFILQSVPIVKSMVSIVKGAASVESISQPIGWAAFTTGSIQYLEDTLESHRFNNELKSLKDVYKKEFEYRLKGV